MQLPPPSPSLWLWLTAAAGVGAALFWWLRRRRGGASPAARPDDDRLERQALRHALDAAQMPVAISDLAGRLTYVNDAFVRAWGYDARDGVVGRCVTSFWQDPAGAASVVDALQAHGRWEGTLLAQRRDGGTMAMRTSAHLVRADDGRPIAMMASFADETALRTAQEALLREREFARRLIDVAPVLVLVLDARGGVRLVNRHFEQLTGWRLADLRRRDWFDIFIPPADRAALRTVFDAVCRGEVVRQHVAAMQLGDGTVRAVEWSSQALFDAAGGVDAVLAIGSDVTERLAAEQRRRDDAQRRDALLQLAQRLELARDAHAVAAALKDEIEARVGYRNVWILLADELGTRYRLEGTAGEPISRLPAPSWSQQLNPAASSLLRDLLQGDAPVVWPDAQLDRRTARTTLAPLVPRTLVHVPLFVAGRRAGLLATGTFGDEGVRVPTAEQLAHLVDLARHAAVAIDRIRYIDALRQRDAQLAQAQALAQVGSWELDHLLARMQWSAELGRILELDATQVEPSSQALLAAVHPDDRQRLVDVQAAALRTRQPWSLRHRLRMADGRIKWVEHRGETVFNALGEPLRTSGTLQDVTRAQLEQQATQAARQQLQRVIDAATEVAITAGDESGRVVLFNTGAERMLGWRADEVVGRMTVREFHVPEELEARARELSVEYGEPVDAMQATRAPALRGDFRPREWTYVRKDGTRLTVSLAITRMLDERGEPAGFLGVAVDVTERKRAERALRDLNVELERRVAERTAELVQARDEAQRASAGKSEFLSHMSHELRTPLNAILGFAQLLEVEPLPPATRRYVDEIRRAGDHLLALITDLLDLSRIESGRLAVSIGPVDVDAAVAQAMRLVQPLADAHAVQVTAGAASCAAVQADPTRLRQVLVNLLSNAVKYNRAGGWVRVDSVALDDGRRRLSVSDSGVGIAADKLERLFTPFERLGAEAGSVEGTGVGLALSRRLVELMGGRLGVQSRPGEGSTFWVDLPAAPATLQAPADRAAARAAAVPQHVLYIEDNPVNVQVLEAMLAHLGVQRVDAAPDGPSGLERARAERPQLILLDIQLPGMDGYAVLDALKADPATCDIPVIALSADAMPAEVERGLARGLRQYLTKPVEMSELMAALERIGNPASAAGSAA
ncbi:PAS domain S-box protein [Calidifontimicrobium sp. SYSU G02091]|uniref:PAS domain S-box protein n=1 Tax=Calidifontimicrobium sp. SYSU G02091 TaxID=2926421 RepID=UPI001F52C29E|nr:PAS domain S-box protein [Calidifontimicrobium sp. SYSU G02091]MCI1191859.1 PAS domain S-box protein [Calidifontimicrobium sp. SYSU G02091]